MEKVAEKLSLVSCAAVSLRYFYPVELGLIESEVMALGDLTVRSIDIHCHYLDELTLIGIRDKKNAMEEYVLWSFIQSKNYNNCLYRKIYIDKKGGIRNCPGMSHCYGLIDDDRLQLNSLLTSPEFKKCWFLTKDLVEECQDCEFRYACLDCRCFLKKPGNLYSKPLKCQYTP